MADLETRSQAMTDEQLRQECEAHYQRFARYGKCFCAEIDFNKWPSGVRAACGFCRDIDEVMAFAKEQQAVGRRAMAEEAAGLVESLEILDPSRLSRREQLRIYDVLQKAAESAQKVRRHEQ